VIDTGGYMSKGRTAVRPCPKCAEDSATQIETTIYGKTRISYFCNTCAHEWKEPREEVSGVR
jgi:hypothetical protein